MAAKALRLRRSLALTSPILNHIKHSSSSSSVLPTFPHTCGCTIQQNLNRRTYDDANQSKRSSSRKFSSLPPRLGDNVIYWPIIKGSPEYLALNLSPEDMVVYEGCDYKHWLILMYFPYYPKPSPQVMVETYVQTAAKILGSVEEAKKKIYACSTTTYHGFQVEVSQEVAQQFKGLPRVFRVLPDSYIDPENKEYGGDKYINGTIIPRPPPVRGGFQYYLKGGRGVIFGQGRGGSGQSGKRGGGKQYGQGEGFGQEVESGEVTGGAESDKV